ncbi:MAG: hypothetical protein KC503_10800 [Myxococcales bacterium]|nr:hypothetical protein [Myxococcales bacterium]
MRSWLWLLGFCLVLALPACSDDKPATDAGPDVAIGDGATDSDGGGGDAGEAKASGPNPLVPEQALYPWPSDYYLVADSSTATGRRLEVPPKLLPFGVKPDALQGVDGFSLIPSILSYLPGGVDKASHPTPDVTITKASAVMLVEQGSWEQVPLLVENDATAADDSQRALILRPLRALKPDTGYAVILRDGLEAPGGTAHTASDAFKALRDGTPSSDAAIEAQRADYKLVEDAIAQLGVDKSSIVLAWSFHTRSKQQLVDDLIRMQELANTATIGEYNITSDKHEGTNRQIVATFKAPNFLGSDGRLARGSDGKVEQQGTTDVEFAITIPDAVDQPRPTFFWGHGFLGAWNQGTRGTVNEIATMGRYITIGTFFGMSEREQADTLAALIGGNLALLHKVTSAVRQNFTNMTALFRLVKEKLKDDLTHQVGSATIKPFNGTVHYAGGSNGGTFGYVAAATSPQVERAAIVVGGGGLSHFLERAVQWNDFKPVVEGRYPNGLDRQLFISIVQLLLDPIDSMSYADYLVKTRLPGRKPLKAAVVMAVNDSQVRNLVTEWVVRSAGIPLVTPSPKQIFGLQTITADPPNGADVPAAFFVYDEKVTPSPTTNEPPAADNKTHGTVGDVTALRQQIIELFDNGKLVQLCTGACDPE